MLFKNKKSLKTAYKALILRAFFDADYQTGGRLAYVMLVLEHKDINSDEINRKYEEIAPSMEKIRHDFIFGGTRIGPLTFDDMYDFIMGDRFNASLLEDNFEDKNHIKQFLDFYLMDSIRANNKENLLQTTDSKDYVPIQYLVFFVEDTSYLKRIVKMYKENGLRVEQKDIANFLADFYNNYCKTSLFTLSDYFFNKI